MGVRLSESTASAYAYPLLIRHLLHTPLATAGRREIVYRDHRRYTYLEFAERIRRLANSLAGFGVEAGGTVAVMDWDSHRYLECYFAVPMLGAILQTVNVRLATEQILFTLQDSGAAVLLVNRDFVPVIRSLWAKLPGVRTLVLLEDDGSPNVSDLPFAGDYESLLASANTDHSFTDFDENAIATTFHTTGTTGKPKAVSFSHRQLVLHTLAVTGALASAPDDQSLRHGDVYMPMTPMFHVHAWGLPYISTLLGLKQVYPGRYDPSSLLALREKEGVTYSHCVPSILQMLLNRAEEQGTDLQGWKITVGGAALSTGLARRALARGLKVFAGYGMSETGPVLTLTRFKPHHSSRDEEERLSILCATGLPVPLVDLRIVDPDMAELPHDGVSQGELLVRAPWLTQDYRGAPLQSDELWRGGYLHTQDLATIDDDGYVQIRDRLKDIIKSGGEWLSSVHLEELISRHPGVAEVAVVAVPHEQWGERPAALIVAQPDFGGILTADSVRLHLRRFLAVGEIPAFAIPERVEFVAELAKTSVGKLDKKRLRARLAGEPGLCRD